jgi:hypothetical protein
MLPLRFIDGSASLVLHTYLDKDKSSNKNYIHFASLSLSAQTICFSF